LVHASLACVWISFRFEFFYRCYQFMARLLLSGFPPIVASRSHQALKFPANYSLMECRHAAEEKISDSALNANFLRCHMEAFSIERRHDSCVGWKSLACGRIKDDDNVPRAHVLFHAKITKLGRIVTYIQRCLPQLLEIVDLIHVHCHVHRVQLSVCLLSSKKKFFFSLLLVFMSLLQ
jgi:hypothetical protein